MKHMQKRRGVAMAVTAAIALCAQALWRTTPADSQPADPAPTTPQENVGPALIGDAAGTIPFEPPVVYPGYGPHMKVFRAERRQPAGARDLMFHPQDRKSFKALRPFLLQEPDVLSVRSQQAPAPSAPHSK